LRALEEENNTTALARSYATQSYRLLDARCDWYSGGSESSYFEGVPVTTYRQVNDIQASQAFMLGSALDGTRGGTARSIVLGLEATPIGD